jgi:hypothetical protein
MAAARYGSSALWQQRLVQLVGGMERKLQRIYDNWYFLLTLLPLMQLPLVTATQHVARAFSLADDGHPKSSQAIKSSLESLLPSRESCKWRGGANRVLLQTCIAPGLST